jgi:hypothetical protein
VIAKRRHVPQAGFDVDHFVGLVFARGFVARHRAQRRQPREQRSGVVRRHARFERRPRWLLVIVAQQLRRQQLAAGFGARVLRRSVRRLDGAGVGAQLQIVAHGQQAARRRVARIDRLWPQVGLGCEGCCRRRSNLHAHRRALGGSVARRQCEDAKGDGQRDPAAEEGVMHGPAFERCNGPFYVPASVLG